MQYQIQHKYNIQYNSHCLYLKIDMSYKLWTVDFDVLTISTFVAKFPSDIASPIAFYRLYLHDQQQAPSELSISILSLHRQAEMSCVFCNEF